MVNKSYVAVVLIVVMFTSVKLYHLRLQIKVKLIYQKYWAS